MEAGVGVFVPTYPYVFLKWERSQSWSYDTLVSAEASVALRDFEEPAKNWETSVRKGKFLLDDDGTAKAAHEVLTSGVIQAAIRPGTRDLLEASVGRSEDRAHFREESRRRLFPGLGISVVAVLTAILFMAMVNRATQQEDVMTVILPEISELKIGQSFSQQ